jgi:hypothetical protein
VQIRSVRTCTSQQYRYDTVFMNGDSSPPRPFRSILRPFLDEIRRMRRARRTWREIAEHLTATYGIRIAPPSVYLFFKRAVHRKTLPLGFEDLPIGCDDSDGPSKPKLALPPAEEESQRQTQESEEISLMPINQRKKGNWFGYDPEQGIHYAPKN